MTQFSTKRDKELDIAKGIGIVLVIFGHLAQREQILRVLVYSFHMPLFFVISGYLNKNICLKKVLLSGIRKLVFPAYLVFAFDCLIRFVEVHTSLKSSPSLFDWANGIALNGGMLWNLPVWFLMTLFVCRLLGQLNSQHSIAICAMCVLFCAMGMNTYLPGWWLTNVIMSYPFYYFGIISNKYRLFDRIKEYKCSLLFVLFGVWVILALFNGYADINIQSNGKSYILFLFTGILGTGLLLKLAYILNATLFGKIMGKIGRKSIVVLLSHYYICRGIVPAILLYFDLDNGLLIQVVLVIILIIIYYSIFRVLEKLDRVLVLK